MLVAINVTSTSLNHKCGIKNLEVRKLDFVTRKVWDPLRSYSAKTRVQTKHIVRISMKT